MTLMPLFSELAESAKAKRTDASEIVRMDVASNVA
jgi:hypothetical protein